MIPNETSLECEICGLFNLTEGVIEEGKVYCWKCWRESNLLKRRINNEI